MQKNISVCVALFAAMPLIMGCTHDAAPQTAAAQDPKTAHDEMARLAVPKVDAPNVRAVPSGGRLIVSVIGAHGVVTRVRVGQTEVAPADHWAALTKGVKEARAEWVQGTDGEEAKKKFEVLLRADLSLPYKEVSPIMDAIAAAGVENINLMAYQNDAADKPAEGKVSPVSSPPQCRQPHPLRLKRRHTQTQRSQG